MKKKKEQKAGLSQGLTKNTVYIVSLPSKLELWQTLLLMLCSELSFANLLNYYLIISKI
ncbi:hypothetical protein [Chryseobacterium sp. CP-77]|uniref:hypothetical protein n=1 Tax=Chryseobacterium sp. CP-77 TaxID=3116594 RepID=UPI002ED29AC3